MTEFERLELTRLVRAIIARAQTVDSDPEYMIVNSLVANEKDFDPSKSAFENSKYALWAYLSDMDHQTQTWRRTHLYNMHKCVVNNWACMHVLCDLNKAEAEYVYGKEA